MARKKRNKHWYISKTCIMLCVLFWLVWNAVFFISSEHRSSFIEFAKWNIMPYDDETLNITVPLRRYDPNAIIFIKTFKTASSSLTSIFHNYCVLHNKSCAVTKPYYLYITWDFNNAQHRENALKLQTWNGKHGIGNGNIFDMWVNHVIFHPFLYELLPTCKHQIVTIVRNPIDRFISGYKYYHKNTKNLNVNMSTYILQLYNNYTKYGAYESNLQPEHIGYQTNSQCRSLIPGYIEPIRMDIYNVWNNIKNGNWLLLITERFDESLLVLKYAYDLTFDDLVFVMHKTDTKYKQIYIPNENERILIKQINECDWKLYQLALKIFDYRLYEIYKGNEKKKQNDLNKLLKIREMKQMQCDALYKKKINENNLYDYNLSVSEYKFYKIIFCYVLNKDNILWNKWSHQYLHNDTFRNIWVNRLMSGKSVCQWCVKLYE